MKAGLAHIGIAVQVRAVDNLGRALTGADLALVEAHVLLPDPVAFLTKVTASVPTGWMPPGVQAEVARLHQLSGPRRDRTAAAFADELGRQAAAFAAYSHSQVGTLLGPRLGCRTFPPFGYGVDLAALCFRE